MPTIAVGWDRGGFDPPRLNTARLGKVAQVEAYEGDQVLNQKLVPNLIDDHDGADGGTSSPLGAPPAPRSDWSQIENKFSRKLHKLVFPKMIFPERSQVEEKVFNKSPQVQKNQKLSQKHHHFQKCQSFFGCGEGSQGGQP